MPAGKHDHVDLIFKANSTKDLFLQNSPSTLVKVEYMQNILNRIYLRHLEAKNLASYVQNINSNYLINLFSIFFNIDPSDQQQSRTQKSINLCWRDHSSFKGNTSELSFFHFGWFIFFIMLHYVVSLLPNTCIEHIQKCHAVTCTANEDGNILDHKVLDWKHNHLIPQWKPWKTKLKHPRC